MREATLKKRIVKVGLIYLLGALLWFMAPPAGVSLHAWHLLIIFVLTIVGVVMRPLPMGSVAVLALTTVCLTHTLPLKVAFSSYSKPVVWLVVLAFFIARGVSKTGLGSRIAYFFVSLFGRNTLGLSYGFVMTELMLAPAVPSNTARGAGIIFPVLKSLVEEYERGDGSTKHSRIGGFLVQVAFQANIITSAMFLTALAGNPLIMKFAGARGIDLSWQTWALAACVPGVICLIAMPILVYLIQPPQVKKIPNARALARQKLMEFGPLRGDQRTMFIIFVGLLGLWVFGVHLNISATLAALMGLAALLLTGVLTWDDMLRERGAWGTFFWFGTLLMLADQLEASGFVTWFGNEVSHMVSGVHWIGAFCIATMVYFYAHYFFASTTAFISTLYAVFLHVMMTSGVPPFMAAMSLAAFSSLSACLTHFGTGTAPVYYGTNTLTMKQWWRLGIILSAFYLLVWWGVGPFWWTLVGLM